MSRLTLAVAAALATAAPANAQMAPMAGMSMPGMKMPAKKKPAAKKPPATKATAKKTSVRKAAVPSKQIVAPHKVAPAAPQEMNAMPGMDMPAGQAMPADPAMPGMESAPPSGTNLPAGNAPPPPIPTDHAADVPYGAVAMAMGRHHLKEGHGGQKTAQIMFNLAEAQFRKGRNGYEWDAEGWTGGDIDRLWVKSQGDGTFGRAVDRADIQLLYSHAIDPYFNLQAGVRVDVRPDPSRVYAAIGVEGLAPSFFDVQGALFLSTKGELLARAEGSYDQRITQRLILQPRAELNFAAQDTPETKSGAGLSDAELGLRLRYDIRREFAPYVGVQYKRAFGETRRYLRQAGDEPGGWSLLTGIRTWF